MQLDRTITPSIKQIESFNILKGIKHPLTNGATIYAVHSANTEMVKIEWIFKAGNWYQPAPMVAFAVNNMLIEGSDKYSSATIVESIEMYGANFSFNVDKDNAFVSLLCQSKYLANVLPIIDEILRNATFPENELNIFRQKHKQNFLIEQSKVRTIARSIQSRILFGNNHPYGIIVVADDFEKLQRDQLIDFHRKNYQINNCNIIVSGKASDENITLIKRYFEKIDTSQNTKNEIPTFEIKSEKNQKEFIEKPDAVQTALRIGTIMVNKTHSDYNGMSVLNCILGGYFGSRLMKTIREEKGYTYGINSILVSFKHSGYLTIVTEVGAEHTKAAIDDIFNEIEILRTTLVPEDELNRVKNYMLGEIVRMFDGPFAQAESLISILEYNLGYEHFDSMINTIKTITSEDILQLAKKYFDRSSFHEVAVGKWNEQKNN